MPTNKHLTDLIINKVESQAVYDYMVSHNLINDDELYLVGGESAAVLYTPQTLTDEQKEQARTNIGAISVADIPEVPVTSVAGKTGAVTLTASDLGLEQAMRFLGTLDDTDDNAIFDGYTNASIVIGGKTITAELGNVVLYNGKEYVYSSDGWEELGDEGSHALKSITITAGNGLTGGGNLSANRTISVKAGTGITVDNNGIHNAGVRSITQDGTDGHKLTINIGGTNTTITIPDNDTTYNEATTSAAGLMSAADKTFVDGAQAQIDGKMNATNPTGSGTFSLGRLEGSTVGVGSIAMGFNTTASGYYSHAEGENTTASNRASHAEGGRTTASGYYSHAEGENTTTTASARYSHAEGGYTTASGWGSHAEGYHTTASSDYQHAQGMYNIADTISAHIVGNGGYDENVGEEVYSNAHTLDWDGNAWFAGDVYVGSTSGTNKDEGSVKLATVAEMPTIEIVRW